MERRRTSWRTSSGPMCGETMSSDREAGSLGDLGGHILVGGPEGLLVESAAEEQGVGLPSRRDPLDLFLVPLQGQLLGPSLQDRRLLPLPQLVQVGVGRRRSGPGRSCPTPFRTTPGLASVSSQFNSMAPLPVGRQLFHKRCGRDQAPRLRFADFGIGDGFRGGPATAKLNPKRVCRKTDRP